MTIQPPVGISEIKAPSSLQSRICPAFFIGLSVLLSFTATVHPEGFRIYGLSAEAQSRGEAVVASVDDASAVWYNPGALTKLGKFDLSVTFNNMIIPAKYTDLANREEKSQRSYFPFLHAYFSSNLGTENLAVGFGVNEPFGLATEYGKTSAFRYITTGGEIILVNFNPTVAYKLHPTFSIGLGLDYYNSTAELRQQYPWGAFVPGAPDGSVTVQGKGDGFGFNTGILYQPLPEHSLGLTYRSQVVVKYGNRKAEVTNIPAALQGFFPAGTGDVYATGAKTSVKFPDIIGLGYAFKPNGQWTWELGSQWSNWDDVRSFVIKAGFEHQYTENFSFSGGYFYDQSPTNEATYGPLVPDGNHHVFSIGPKYKRGDFAISLPVVGLIQTGTDSINSAVADATGTQNTDGKYSLYFVQIALGINYRF